MSALPSENKRILWLDGIKGISAFFIFFHHYCLGIFPATLYGTGAKSFFNGWDAALPSSPLGFIVNGNFFVHLFILISGYVITSKIISMDHDKAGLFLFKRYLKLLFPIGVYAFILLITKVAPLIGGENSAKEVIKECYRFARSLLFGVLFTGDTYIGTHLWMLNVIFLGGIFVSIIASLCWTCDEKKVFFVAAAVGLFLLLFPSSAHIHFASIFFGCALNIFNRSYKIKASKILFALLFIVGLFFGSYPSGFTPENIYKHFIIPGARANTCLLWHCFAAFAIVFSVSQLSGMQSFFSKKLFLFLGQISLWIYLLQGIVISVTNGIFIYLQEKSIGYILSAAIYFVITLSILILVSWLCAKFVSPFGNNLVNKLMSKLQKREPTLP